MTSAEALFTAKLRGLHCDCSVAIKHCHDAGQLSRAVYLSEAREALMQAIHTPAKDERQLTLDASHDAKGN